MNVMQFLAGKYLLHSKLTREIPTTTVPISLKFD